MNEFKENLKNDLDIFINDKEFAEEHNLNGIICRAIIENFSAIDITSKNGDFGYDRLYMNKILVYCLKSDLNEVPVYGQTFKVDKEFYLVENCSEEEGVLIIQLVANER